MDPYKSQIKELIRQGLLKVALEIRNVPAKVYVEICCSHPTIEEEIDHINRDKIPKLVLFPLYQMIYILEHSLEHYLHYSSLVSRANTIPGTLFVIGFSAQYFPNKAMELIESLS